ncbi:glycosyl hydrolase family 8 [Paenibacillus sp. ACRRX]|uniref:glycosyl hydrolase family 8 n=1 Tax=unclassified Paenibacillus TaxID=185978 RepID=UPI001EF6C55E|nr:MULTISPECIES: glycosyl hydrolase family 8 [unclassified Paenibacillus]MCG7407226.1 glycosyl hydrolase family 8 [Paenibacillus sp. ACRRX]MDK8180445.1 glycosyl hydrolase family 8 [Paenibacillus sp. UMB4589-SE434]
MFKSYKLKATAMIALLVAMLVPVSGIVSAAGPDRPFPQHTSYTSGSIKPNHVTQSAMDNTVKSKWNSWKSKYLKPAGTGKYYVKYNSKGETVSEAHGYGMLLTVIMAGHEANAQGYFDGLYQYYKAHPSNNNSYLMAWKQNSSFQNIGGANSATDGDMDIAYALLLADKQWGSSGTINYLQAAINMINAIMAKDVNQSKWTTRLGDWATSGTEDTATRPSDFMLSHMKAFGAATGDAKWTNVINKTYSIINTLYTNNSPNTGLLPDFVILSGGVYKPVSGELIESEHDGHYHYNSCRTPWRITTDYLISGDNRALSQLNQLNSWIKAKTGNSPANIVDGYKLNGSNYGSYNSGAFHAPFGVSAMTNSSNQSWLNSVWTHVANSAAEEYYEDSIKLFSLIVMSGNWWTP